jgi:hypothetical protein
MQGMEKNLMSMAKEVEKLRADIANAEKRIQQGVALILFHHLQVFLSPANFWPMCKMS